MAQITDITLGTDRVLFISDSHLGSGSDSLQRERQLCTLLDRFYSSNPSSTALFLLGDIFDFWFSYRHLVPRGHVRLLGKLAALADAGVEIHFFSGNHDMWVFDYLTRECGVIMHDQPQTFTIAGRRFLIGHGDGLGNLDRGFNFIRFFFRSPFCHRLFKMLPSSLTFAIAHRWSDSNKRKHRRQDTLRYLGDDREGIVLFCRQRLQKEHLDYCVFGHRHTPLTRPIPSPLGPQPSLYVNTGDWLINRNYTTFSPENGIQIHDFLKD